MADKDNYWLRSAGRMNRRRFVAGSGVAAAGAAALLAGCGDDDDDEGATPAATTAAATGTAATTGTAAATTAAANAPVKGGTLKMAKPQVDEGLDPGLKVVNNGEFLPSLYNWTHVYQVSTNTFLMDAATKMETPDATTIRFTIRPGMKFHNGDAVTAEDVAYSWSRFPDLLKNQGSQVNAANWGFIKSAVAPDATTVVVTLNAPTASAPVLMASTAYGIVNKKQVEASAKKNVQDEDAGAGPYKLDKRDATGTKVSRFANYYKHETANAIFGVDSPYIDSWETSIIVDGAAAKSAFLAGNLDIYPQLGVTINDKLEFESLRNKTGITAKQVDPVGNGMFMAFDNVRFTDKRARQAISEAIDYNALVATIYAGEAVYDGPVGIALSGFVLDQATLKSYRKFDAANAKKLWEAAGKPFSTIRIELNQAPISTQYATFLKSQLEANLGVKVELLQHDTTTWVARAREPQKQWELFLVPTGFTSTVEGGNLNLMAPGAFAGVSWSFAIDQAGATQVQEDAKKLQALVQAQSEEIDPAKRKQKVTDLQKGFLEAIQPGFVFPAAGRSYLAYNSRLQGVLENDYLKGLGIRNHNLWIKA